MSQPSDDASGADDLLNTLTFYFERQPEPEPENEALQLDIDAWMQAQKRPVQLRPAARGTSDSARRVAELAPPPVAESVSSELLGDLNLGGGGGGRWEEAAAASPAEEMRERALQRERRKRADRGKQLDPRTKAHPIDTSGEPRGAEVAFTTSLHDIPPTAPHHLPPPPKVAFTASLTQTQTLTLTLPLPLPLPLPLTLTRQVVFVTSLHDKGDGFYDIDLHVDGEPEVRGRARFIDRCPKEGGVLVARALRGASTAELTHLDVAAPLRGGGGGIVMMAAMGDALAARGCAYVLLDHFDKGSGRLVRFYEGLGFEFARAVLAEAMLDDGELDQVLTDKHMLAPLATMRDALALAG